MDSSSFSGINYMMAPEAVSRKLVNQKYLQPLRYKKLHFKIFFKKSETSQFSYHNYFYYSINETCL